MHRTHLAQRMRALESDLLEALERARRLAAAHPDAVELLREVELLRRQVWGHLALTSEVLLPPPSSRRHRPAEALRDRAREVRTRMLDLQRSGCRRDRLSAVSRALRRYLALVGEQVDAAGLGPAAAVESLAADEVDQICERTGASAERWPEHWLG